MYWYDAMVTFVLSIVIFLIIGFGASILLKLTSRKHMLGITMVAVMLALLVAFIFTI